jgi:hypothetical protein
MRWTRNPSGGRRCKIGEQVRTRICAIARTSPADWGLHGFSTWPPAGCSTGSDRASAGSSSLICSRRCGSGGRASSSTSSATTSRPTTTPASAPDARPTRSSWCSCRPTVVAELAKAEAPWRTAITATRRSQTPSTRGSGDGRSSAGRSTSTKPRREPADQRVRLSSGTPQVEVHRTTTPRHDRSHRSASQPTPEDGSGRCSTEIALRLGRASGSPPT